MSQYWETLAARTNGLYTPEDFEIAAYRLVSEQVLYHADHFGKIAYALIDQYERDFRAPMSALGIDVFVNRQLRYACAIPRHGKAGTATAQQTLFALVLRDLYDEGARHGACTDDGEVICGLVELEEKYRLLTGRVLPGKGEFDALLRVAKRWGIARKSTDGTSDIEIHDGMPFAVVIRPAIVDLLGETALQRLAQWPHDSGAADAPEVAQDQDEEDQETLV